MLGHEGNKCNENELPASCYNAESEANEATTPAAAAALAKRLTVILKAFEVFAMNLLVLRISFLRDD